MSAPSSKALTLEALREIAASVGFPDVNVAAAVAMAESSGVVDAIGDRDKGDSIGLWQINVPAHPEFTRELLFNANYNARAAFVISKGGTDWHAWTRFRDGTYLRFMPGGSAS